MPALADIAGCYIGADPADAIYLGAEQVWPTTPAGPNHLDVVQSTVAAPSVWVTWDRSDPTVTQYDVLRDGAVIHTVGPFVPYDWTDATHRNVAGWPAGVAPFDDTWDKCAFEDTTVAGGSTHTYRVRAYVDALPISVSPAQTITVQQDADFGPVVNAPAPSGGDDLAALSALVAPDTVLVLQAGTYLLSAQLTLAPGMVLRGQGKDVTKLHPTFAGGTAGNGPVVVGYTGAETTTAGTLSVAIAPGAYTATLTDTSDLRAGSIVRFVGNISGSSGPGFRAAAVGSAGKVHDLVEQPGIGYDEENEWEANEVTGIAGNVVTFRFPFSQPIPTAATVARIGEATPGTRSKPSAVELLTIEGNLGTSGSNDYFKLARVEAVVGWRFAKCRFRYANQHAIEARTTHQLALVDCDEPHHGACVTSQQQYTFSLNRSSNARGIACSAGTDGVNQTTSPWTFQRCPRFLARHCQVFWPLNYGFDEHGANTRDWVVENCRGKMWSSATAAQGTKRGLVFMGNSSFTMGGRGIVRNTRTDGGPCVVDMQENSYEVRVLDNIAYDLTPTGNSPQSALCKGYGWDAPDDIAANWGSIRWPIKRNAVFRGLGDGIDFGGQTSVFWGDGGARGPDQAGDGQGYLGVKDVILEDNHFDVTGMALRLRGIAPRTARFQARRLTGNARYLRPALTAGCHWVGNAESAGYAGSAFTRDFGADVATSPSWEPAGGAATWISLLAPNNSLPTATVVLSTTYKGRIAFFSGSTSPNAIAQLRPQVLDDSQQRRTLVYSTTNPGNKKYGIVARHLGGAWDSDCYLAILTNAATPTLEIIRRRTTQTDTTSSKVDTQLATVNLGALTNNADTFLVLDVTGTRVSAKCYQGADPTPGAPSTWALSVTDSDPLTLAGLCGVLDSGPAAQTNSMDTKKYELLSGAKGAVADYGAAAAAAWESETFEWIGAL